MANSRFVQRRRLRRPIKLALVLVCAGLCLCAGLFEKPAQTPHETAAIRTVTDSLDDAVCLPALSDSFNPRRPLYPYSVIPGGAINRAELTRAIDRDPVVARHYAGFGAGSARIVRAQDAKLVHVSYRMDNKVFWSAKKVRLARGETLITDGTNLARTRCGNRVSVLPQEPTSPEEPPVEALESPAVPEKTESALVASRLDIGDPTYLLPDIDHHSLALPVLFNPPVTRDWTSPNISPVVPMSPAPHAVTPPVSPGTLPEVPEPSTIVLLASGLAAAVLLKIRARSRCRP